MRDKPKGGMRQKSKRIKGAEKHDDAKQDKKLVKKMVKGDCMK